MKDGIAAVSEAAVADQLDRLCRSSALKNSTRLCRFLRYTVEALLGGEGETLKEYVIGTEVYDRKPPYHPSQDSIVRTEAKRLRNKLKEYYETEGTEDEVLIYYQSGTYRPIVRRRTQGAEDVKTAAAKLKGSATTERAGVTVAVLSFRHQEGDPVAAAIAAGVTDELIFLIASTEGCHVIAPQTVAIVESHIADMSLLSDVLNVDQVITGSVRKDASHVRVSVTGVHPSGLETWSKRFDLTTSDNDLIVLEEQTASAIMARIAPQRTVLRNKKARVSKAILSAFPEILSAESAVDQGTASSLRSALTSFQHLALRFPASPRVHCGISQCYYSLACLGERLENADVRQANTAAAKALELDPDMGEAHAAMACSLVLEHQCNSAEDHYRRALSLGATSTIRQRYADLLMAGDRFDEASMQLREAGRLDPCSCRQRVSIARLNYLMWQTSGHAELLQNAIQYGPVPSQALLFQAELLLRMNRANDAAALADSLMLRLEESTPTLSAVAGILALAGRTEGASTLIERFHLLDEHTSVSRTYQARLCICLQDEEGCESFLGLAIAHKEPQLGWIETDPRFDSLRSRGIYKRAVETARKPNTIAAPTFS